MNMICHWQQYFGNRLTDNKQVSKLILFTMLAMIAASESYGQVYANDWIDYSQDYIKFSVATDGIYKVTQPELLAAGLGSGTDPRNFQVFHRGKEMAIFVEGQNDGSFDPSDYILFYGKRNDGTLDKELYVSPAAQPHQYYNLFSDSSAYFFTIHNSSPGKRINVTNEDATALPLVTHHLEEKLVLYTQDYWRGREYSADTYLSQYDFGEGWTGTHFKGGQSRDIVFTGVTQTYQGGEDPQIELVLTGRNANLHNVEILVGPSSSSLRSLTTFQFVAHENYFASLPIAWTDISGSGELYVRVAVHNTAVTDYISISSVKLAFPQLTDMQGANTKRLKFSNLPSKSKLSVLNTSGSPIIYDITDPYNISELESSTSGTTITSVLVPGNRSIFISDQFITVPQIKEINFQVINPATSNFLIVSNTELMAGVGGINPVSEYANYRASQAGGSYQPLVTDIQQLFDQFNYGEASPRSIREFAKYMFVNGNPQYLFIIGKGLSVIYDYYRKGPTGTFHSYVPTYGEPGSDIALTAGLDSSQPYAPAIPVGRLTAETPEQVMAYLNKVKEMEAVPFDALWRKNLVHLSGGKTESELISFKRFVNDFKAIAEGPYLGGKVMTRSKNSNNTVELINIADEVNKGLSLITFFGHSGPVSADIEIGYASEDVQGYRNKGKYPFILVNGCDAGNIYGNVHTFGQDWIVTADRGAVGFIAHSARGLSSSLKKYSDKFYETAFGDSAYINKSIGHIQQKLIRDYLSDYLSSPPNISQVQQMVLQGDPALKIFANDKPDYEVIDQNIAVQSFDDKNVTALADSFYINFIVDNFGIAVQDTLYVQLRRELSNGSSFYYDTLFAPVLYSDTLQFIVENLPENNNFGDNKFEISVDYNNSIAENNESNNIATIDYFIPLGGTTNIYPPEFAIVSDGEPELIAQSNNILEESRTYLFELDTTDAFNSSIRKQFSVNADGLASWKPQLLESLSSDSIVYFWRTKFAEPKPGEDSSWAESSFVYIKESPEGWSQSHFSQFKKSKLTGFSLNSNSREFDFLQNEVPIKIISYGSAHEGNYYDVQVLLNNTPVVFTSGWKACRNNSMGAIAMDRSSLEAYLLYTKSVWNDPTACGREPFVINNFNSTDIVNTLKLNAYIEAIPEGDYVLLFSFGSNTYESWPQEVKDALITIGASQTVLDDLSNGEPYILIGKKGGGAVVETKGAVTDEIIVEQNLVGKYNSGTITSSQIGPAKAWGNLFTKATFSEEPGNDSFSYDVIGMDLNNNETVLMEDLSAEEISLGGIDAASYPLIKIKMHISDEVDLTPVQLEKWLVLYEPMPEGVLLLDKSYKHTLPKVEKSEGEEVEMDYVFKNISNKDFEDSLTVAYSVYNQSSKTSEEKTLMLPALSAEDTASFKIRVSTIGKRGLNNLTVNVNPRIIPELNYTNNSIDLSGYLDVKGDLQHPTIEVAFDGEYIMDGDIVSPDPVISVIMKDKNAFLQKKDTIGIELMLRKPCENCSYEKVNFSSADVVWTPATDESDFKVEYRPGILDDGIYSLKVQAVDGSNNLSGTKPYTINFEVINESSITNFYPYPNPFSTSTRFVFTLTGSEVPDQIKIQIMTVTGKIVREITQHELGPVKIGNNISDFSWNGKDEFGDQLANGVYLYRVIVVNNGDKLKHRETSADQAFKNGFGKMYLLR